MNPDGLGYVAVVKGETVKVTAQRAEGFLSQPANWQLDQDIKNVVPTPPTAKGSN